MNASTLIFILGGALATKLLTRKGACAGCSGKNCLGEHCPHRKARSAALKAGKK